MLIHYANQTASRCGSAWRVAAAALCLAAVLSLPGRAAGEFVLYGYNAGDGAQPRAPAPPWGTSYMAPGDVQGAANDFAPGRHAWQVEDDSNSIYNPTYRVFLSNDASTSHAPDGWRLSATARVVDFYRDGPAMGIIAYFGNRRYGAALGLDAQGRLVAEVLGQMPSGAIDPQRFFLPGDPTGYHDLRLDYTPGVAGVAFSFDGAELVRWSGLTLNGLHPNTFEWGSVGVTERGAMRFRSVEFSLGPFPEPLTGDFNGDDVVDVADFTLWRDAAFKLPADPAADANRDGRVDMADYRLWRDNFGERSAAATSTVPEPATLLLALFALSPRLRRGIVSSQTR